MRILVTGASGMLGQDVQRVAGGLGHECLAYSRVQLDITNFEQVSGAIEQAAPDAVINCAAWTNVDGAEDEEERATEVNGAGAGHVALAARHCGAWMIQISSDYVFDGKASEPYVESDRTGPLSAYGRSKLIGERAVSAAAPEAHTIVRTSWLFGAGGPCFPATIRRLASERDELKVVEDQIGCPTYTGHLALGLLELVRKKPLGVVHMAGHGACSWFQFAREIVSAAELSCEVKPCSTADMPRPAPRPAYSVLVSRREEVPRLPDWQDGLSDYMKAGVSVA